MSTKKTSTKKTQPQTGNGPDFLAYTVIDRGEGQKGIWRQVGSAWLHNDGNGMQLRLDAFPVDGVVTLRAPLPDEAEA